MSFVMTSSCTKFYLDIPSPYDVKIEDIAVALSRIPRFNGHGNRFYSVAEHSWYLSYLVSEDLSLAALLHDAAESYIGDMVRPLRLFVPEFTNIEERVNKAITEAFGISPDSFTHPTLVDNDNSLLLTEAVCLGFDISEWGFSESVRPVQLPFNDILCWDPLTAEKKFLHRFSQLYSY